MVSERIQRRIDALFDEADEAADARDWGTVRSRAEDILALDGDNAVEQGVVGFVDLAEGALADALTHFVAAVEGFGHEGGDFLRARVIGSHAMSLRN